MTLAEMAEHVCDKVRQSDITSLAKCKAFLARRYAMIWNGELWKDSVWAYDFTWGATPENEDAAGVLNQYAKLRGAWLFPSAVDKVLALRQSDYALPVMGEQEFYRIGLDLYAETGDPVRFHQMPRIVAYSDVVSSTSDEDTDVLLTDSADSGLSDQVSVRYLDRWGEVQEQSGTAASLSIEAILSVTKPVTTGALSFVGVDSSVEYFRLNPTLTTGPLRTRIRLSPIPSGTLALKALVKLKAQSLAEDGDEPQLQGVENCLMSFAQADMLQRARQYGKAQVSAGEAIALLNELKTVAVAQEASSIRLIPDVTDVAGEVWNGTSGKGVW